MSAMVGASSRSLADPAPGRLYVSTTAPMTVGMCTTLPWTAWICSSFIGPSVAPKSTVPSVNWRIPPPEPIDW
jgi:hypothetical protein